MATTKKSLPEKMKAARAKLGLTQAEAAEEWGINRRTLENWESERYKPTNFTAKQLESMLDGILDT